MWSTHAARGSTSEVAAVTSLACLPFIACTQRDTPAVQAKAPTPYRYLPPARSTRGLLFATGSDACTSPEQHRVTARCPHRRRWPGHAHRPGLTPVRMTWRWTRRATCRRRNRRRPGREDRPRGHGKHLHRRPRLAGRPRFRSRRRAVGLRAQRQGAGVLATGAFAGGRRTRRARTVWHLAPPGQTYINDWRGNRVVKWAAGNVVAFADVAGPVGIAIGHSGDVYVAQPQARQISRISADGKRSDFATNLDEPRDPVFDSHGNLYVAETLAGRILVYPGSF